MWAYDPSLNITYSLLINSMQNTFVWHGYILYTFSQIEFIFIPVDIIDH